MGKPRVPVDHRDHLTLSTPFYLVRCFDVLWERIAGSAGTGTESSWGKSISLLISGGHFSWSKVNGVFLAELLSRQLSLYLC